VKLLKSAGKAIGSMALVVGIFAAVITFAGWLQSLHPFLTIGLAALLIFVTLTLGIYGSERDHEPRR